MQDFRNRIAALSDRQRELLAQRLDARAELVAYVAGDVDEDTLRAELGERLPSSLVPSSFVVLDALPRTTTGKLDRRALPAPDVRSTERPTQKASRAEQELAAIWAALLGVDEVRPDDDFFELGGDSLLSIRLIARARQAGFDVDPRRFAADPTVAGMLASAAVVVPDAEVEAPEGRLPLTPIQQWFFEQDFPDRHHWNQAVLVEIPVGVEPAAIERAVHDLAARHEALRLRFEHDGTGWRQEVAPAAEHGWFGVTDLTACAPRACAAAIEAVADQRQASFDLGVGRLLRAERFAMPDGLADRLLVIVHHLAVDEASWGVLLDDLAASCRGHTPPAPTAPFARWVHCLAARARSPDVAAQAAHWLALDAIPLPVDVTGGRERNDVASEVTVSAALDVDGTRALLHEAHDAYRTRVDDLLLAALARTLARWSGGDRVRIDLEGHGREQSVGDLDVSRTVGWFTTVYPVQLELEADGDPEATIKSIKEQLRCTPDGGIGHGLLRCLGEDASVCARLAAQPRADVVFNYLGRRGPDPDGLATAPEATGRARSALGTRPYLLEINAVVADGVLRATWTFSENVHRRATVAALATRFVDEVRALVTHCTTKGAGGATPSDFPLAGLDQAQLDSLGDLLEQDS